MLTLMDKLGRSVGSNEALAPPIFLTSSLFNSVFVYVF